MKKNFRTIKDILHAEKKVSGLTEIKKSISDNNQWMQVFGEVLSKLPYQKTKGIKDSIIRITENQSKNTIKKIKTDEVVLTVRMNSSSAVTRFKLIAPLILRDLNNQGLRVNSLKPSVSYVKI